MDCTHPTLDLPGIATESRPTAAATHGHIAEFVIPGEPKGKGRHRSRIAGKPGGKQFVHAYAPKETVEYENLVRMAAHDAMAGRELLAGAVAVDISVHTTPPMSWSKKKRAAALAGQIRPTSKPDCSNVLKAVEDGMNGIVFDDDKQIVQLSVSKTYRETPCVTVRVWGI